MKPTRCTNFSNLFLEQNGGHDNNDNDEVDYDDDDYNNNNNFLFLNEDVHQRHVRMHNIRPSVRPSVTPDFSKKESRRIQTIQYKNTSRGEKREVKLKVSPKINLRNKCI